MDGQAPIPTSFSHKEMIEEVMKKDEGRSEERAAVNERHCESSRWMIYRRRKKTKKKERKKRKKDSK